MFWKRVSGKLCSKFLGLAIRFREASAKLPPAKVFVLGQGLTWRDFGFDWYRFGYHSKILYPNTLHTPAMIHDLYQSYHNMVLVNFPHPHSRAHRQSKCIAGCLFLLTDTNRFKVIRIAHLKVQRLCIGVVRKLLDMVMPWVLLLTQSEGAERLGGLSRVITGLHGLGCRPLRQEILCGSTHELMPNPFLARSGPPLRNREAKNGKTPNQSSLMTIDDHQSSLE